MTDPLRIPQLPPSKEWVQVHTNRGWVTGEPAESLYTADQMYDFYRKGVEDARAFIMKERNAKF